MSVMVRLIDDPFGHTMPRVHRCDGRFFDWMLHHLPPEEVGGRPVRVLRVPAGETLDPRRHQVALPDWGFTPKPGDEVTVIVSPADPGTLGIIAISFAVSLASAAVSAALAPDIKKARHADIPTPSPTYSFGTPQNAARLGQPVSVSYGRLTMVPDLAAQSYSYFENNEHFVEVLLCIGMGHYNVTRVFAGESDLDRLPDGVATWATYGPDDHGQVHGAIAADFGLWGEDVVTSPDVAGLEVPERSAVAGIPAAVDFIAPDTVRVWSSDGALEDFEDGTALTVSGSASNNGLFTIASQSAGAGYVDFDVTSGVTNEAIATTSLGTWTDAVASKNSGVQTYVLTGMPLEGALPLSPGDIVRVECTEGNDQYGEVRNSTVTYGVNSDGDQAAIHTLKIKRIGGSLNDGDPGDVEVFTVDNAPTLEIGVSREWRGYFNVTKSGQAVEAIALDFTFPAGLYKANATTGALEEDSVDLRIQYQPIDDAGDPTGSKVSIDLTISTTDYLPAGDPLNTPLRFTHEIAPAAGQYRVRVRRTSAASEEASDQSRVVWAGLKGRRPVQPAPVYGAATMLAVRIKATEGLSEAAISTIRADIARRLPVVSSTRDGSSLGQTRNPATIIYDMATDPDFGMGLDPGETFDIAELIEAKSLWEAASMTFDHTFSEFTTLWDAMGLAAQAALAEPLAYSGKVTIAQEGPKATPVQMFSPQNITAGDNGGSSLELDFAFDRDQDIDGIKVIFRDQSSGKEREALWPADAVNAVDRPVAGVTDETIALDMAKIEWRKRGAAQFSASWETELEGRILRRGEMVRLADPQLSATSITGQLVAASGEDLTLDRDMPTDLPGSVWVMMRDADGRPTNWLAATKTGARTLTLAAASPITLRPLGQVGEPTHVAVASLAGASVDLIVDEIESTGDVTMRIKARGYSAAAYAGTFAEALET